MMLSSDAIHVLGNIQKSIIIPDREVSIQDKTHYKGEAILASVRKAQRDGLILNPEDAQILTIEPGDLGLTSWNINITPEDVTNGRKQWINYLLGTPCVLCFTGVTLLSRKPLANAIDFKWGQNGVAVFGHFRLESLWAVLPILESLGGLLDNPDGQAIIKQLMTGGRDIIEYAMDGWFSTPILYGFLDVCNIQLETLMLPGVDTILLKGYALKRRGEVII
jgi:hypothetical protein